MSAPVTLDTIAGGRLRNAGHLNYGRLGGGVLWQHTEIPRLQALDRPLRPEEPSVDGRRRVREWSVDGSKAGSIEAAVDALNVPAVLTAPEAAILPRVPADWVELHAFRTALGDELGEPVGTTLLTLRLKGAVETEMRPGEPHARPWIRRAPEAATDA